MAKYSCDEEEFELVPRMRIDFNLLPVDGQVTYEYYSIATFIRVDMYLLVGHDVRTEVHLHQTHPPVYYTGLERLDSAKQLNQLKYGDPGFFFVRGDLTFVDRFPGNDWGQKFYNARQFIVREMHCKLDNGQLLLTHLNPSEDALRLINLISEDSTTPTLILKGLVPYEWFADEPSTLKLRNFFHSLGRLRDFHVSRMNVSIRFEDYEECCKAIKKLCWHSLKKNGNSSIFFDYELTFEDSLGFNASQDIDNESPTSQAALKHRVAMLEKELKTVKAIFEKDVDAINVPLTIHVFKNRVAMLGKEFSTLKPLIERSGAGDNCSGDNESPATLVHQVAILEKESNALKALLEESSVCYTETPATQALKRQVEMLEHRLAMLEREDKRKRRMDDHDHHDIGINNMAMYNMMGGLGGPMRYDQRSGFTDYGGASSSSMPLQLPMVGPNNFPLPW